MEHPERNMPIILVHPEGDANIGAACRAMKSMGFTSLKMVLSEEREPNPLTVRTWALRAFDIYEESRRYPALAEALEDTSFSVGFTRRTGSRRRTRFFDLEEIAPVIAGRVLGGGEMIALIFGNEKSGLDSDELALCSAAASIDSHFAFPSLNLSHAVQIVCYTLRRALMGAASGAIGSGPGIPRQETETAAAQITGNLREIGFFTLGDSTYLENFFRDLIERAGFNAQENRYFENLFAKIRDLKLHRPE